MTAGGTCYLQFIKIEVNLFVQKGKNIVNVMLDGMPLSRYTIMGQVFLNVLKLKGMVFIGLLQKNVPKPGETCISVPFLYGLASSRSVLPSNPLLVPFGYCSIPRAKKKEQISLPLNF